MLASKKYEEAVSVYSEAILVNPYDPDLYMKRGNAYEKMGDYDNAAQDYDKASQLYKD